MINEKEKTIEASEVLNNKELRDKLYAEFLRTKLKESTEGIRNGEVITLEELRTHIDELEEKYENNNIQ